MGQPQMLTRFCITHELTPDDLGRAISFQPTPAPDAEVGDQESSEESSGDGGIFAHEHADTGGPDGDELHQLLSAVDMERVQLAFRQPVANLMSTLRAHRAPTIDQGPAMFASESRTARGFQTLQEEAEQEDAASD